MDMKYFVISDIHGHFDEMIRDLSISKYDQTNKNHHLIVLGDLFDRGTQSDKVLDYMYELMLKSRVSFVLGNHDNFLLDFLKGDYSRTAFNMNRNGFKNTLESLSGREITYEENWDEISYEIKSKYIYLYNFLSIMPYYLEIGDYIFAHGGTNNENGDWRNNSKRDFIWGRESNFDRIKGKTVVVGHERISTIRYPKKDQKKLFLTNPDAFNILRKKGKIFIDAYVEISKKINVLVLEIKDEDWILSSSFWLRNIALAL